MSNSELVAVELSARCPLTELTLVDSDFRTVASGVARLDASLPGGLYELRANAGDGYQTEIIALRSTVYIREGIEAPFGTVTPSTGTEEARFVEALSEKADRTRAGGTADLIVSVDGGRQEFVELLDEDLQRIPGNQAQPEATDITVSVWSSLQAPGGYLLRFPGESSARSLPLWLLPGQGTVVFVPPTEYGPDPGAAVVHVSPADAPWRADRDRDVMLEALLRTLQSACPLLPESVLQPVRRWGDAPMVALGAAVAAHGTGHADSRTLIKEAARLLPGHADVAALEAITGLGRPVSWPPMLAATYWRALLPSDHAGTPVIQPGSRLSALALGLSWSGPYVTVSDGLPDAGEWVRSHRAALSRDADHPLRKAIERRDARSVAVQTRLPLGAAHEVTEVAQSGIEDVGEAALRLLKESLLADPEATRVTVPGRREWHIAGGTVQFSCEWDSADGLVHAAALSEHLPRQFPLLLSRLDDNVRHLAQFVDGFATWVADAHDLYQVSVPDIERIGDRLAFEALSLAPEPVATFSTVDEPLRRVTTIAEGRLRLAAFERADHDLELTVRSQDRNDAGSYAVVSVRGQRMPDEELVVPLIWLSSQQEASGSVRLGRPRAGANVFVVPELQHAGELRVEIVRRSIEFAANNFTKRALIALLERLAGEA